MILEGIVTTENEDGSVNISPMGPIVDAEMKRLLFRPYKTSRTYRNLRRTGYGVLHITDDVELFAQAAIGQPDPVPELVRCDTIPASFIRNACRWYGFQVASVDDSHDRTEIAADVIAGETLRDFFGFNRAKHAVIEAAILATRIEILPREQIEEDYAKLSVLVEKTGGPAEHRAFEFLQRYTRRKFDNRLQNP